VMQGLVEPPDTIYAVTIEPVGGSPQPTGEPVASSPS
jgi:anti-sigma-K factor RskA